MKALKLGNKMKTVDISKPTVQTPARYVLFIQHSDGLFKPMPVEMPDPMKALRRIANLFEGLEGFDDITGVKCADVTTGVEQWELTIK